jgi:hypothetical protein
MAVAPVGHADPVQDAGVIAAELSNQLTTALLVAWESGFVPPDQILAGLRVGGEAATEKFRRFRLDRMLDRELDAGDCAELSRIVQHRYLLLTWVHEEIATGLEENSTDYTSAGFAKDVARLHYDRIHGVLTGVLVDLWQAELLWEARATYDTPKVYSGAAPAAEELAKARDQGVLEFVRLLASP